jgi:hypothetical protein
MSDISNGFRRLVQLGNTNHNASWTIKNLPKSKFYWSIQAIDNAFAGSAFAAEQRFVLGDTVWPGDTNNNRLVNQADVLPIGLNWGRTRTPAGIVPRDSIVTSVASQPHAYVPQRFALYLNVSNPFNPSTTIQYDLPPAVEVKLEMFDILGADHHNHQVWSNL